MTARNFRHLALAAIVLPLPALAQDAGPAADAIGAGTRFTLAAPSVRPPLRTPAARSAARSQQAMPRDLPEVRAEDALPPPELEWRPARGAVLKVKPAKLRFNWDF